MEFRQLNLVDLDVAELERRLELSVASDVQQAQSAPWICIYKNGPKEPTPDQPAPEAPAQG